MSRTKVDRQMFAIGDLEEAPYQARTISQRALGGLTASLDRFGVLVLPVVNLVRGQKPRIVAGHQRIGILREQGVTEVECVVVQLDRSRERLANFALNNPAIEGEFVPELTERIVEQIREAVGDDADKLFADLQIDHLLNTIKREATAGDADRQVRSGKTADDEDAAAPMQTKAVSKRGKVYQIGNHRILCAKIVGAGSLDGLGVEAAAMSFTHLDTQREADFDDGFVDSHLLTLTRNSTGGVYIATRMPRLAMIQSRFVSLGGHLSNTLVAYKPASEVSGVGYQDVSIPILYGWRDGVTRSFFGDNPGNTIQLKSDIERGRLPVEIAVIAMLNSSKVGEHVFDSNVTRGESLIAAEKTGRRLVGICPSPRQLDRVRQRWTRFAKGEKANWRTATKEAS